MISQKKAAAAFLSFFLACRPLPAEEAPPRPRHAQVHDGVSYERPGAFDFLKYQVADQKAFFKTTFRREKAPVLGVVVAATGVLMAYDHSLYHDTLRQGDKWNIPHTSQQKTLFKIHVPFSKYKWSINGPNDSGTALYFLGDGVFHTAIMGSFLGVGLAARDDRALLTASQLAEGIIANGLLVQALKHTTGRENPNTETKKGGKWRFFPNQKDYAKHVNKYDAFPSGHLPTALVTVTVIADNYPEYRFVRPVGYTLMGGLAFQMVNNGVHWWSDYPLALYLGWTYAKIATGRGHGPASQTAWNVSPSIIGGAPGLAAYRRFGGS
jgi:hypothetical protein